MDRHEQFLTHKTSEVKHLIKWNSKNMASTTTLFYASHKVVQDSYKYGKSLEILGTLRTVFCLCYQYTFESDKSKKDYVSIEQTMIAFDKLKIDEIQQSLDDQLKKSDFCHWTEVSVVLDILVLHMTLYHKVSDIVQSLEDVQNLIYQGLEKRNDLTTFQRKLMVCYIDSLLLHKERASIVDELEAEKVKALFLQNLQLWLELEYQENCDLLMVILPKLIKLVAAGEILTKVWDMIMTLHNSAKTVSMLHLTADIWFPVESEHIKELIDQSLEERLWLLLLKELSSSSPQRSKPALQLTKKVVDFIDKYRTKILRFPDYQKLRPLVCTGNDSQQEFFKQNLKNWFLILEELKKETRHSVTPTFLLLRNLLKKEPDGLHIAWIRCTLSQVLQDSLNVVVKWGLLEVFALELELYNDEFLGLVLNALNNTSFYEIDMSEEEPTVVKELSILLNNAETNNTDLVTRFMVKASKMTWQPVPLFYFIHALSMVTKVESVWTEAELEAVESLAETCITMDCPMLRIGSQIELLESTAHFATESLDLIAVAKTLSAFPTNEALIRGQLAWKRTSVWLSKLVKEDKALSFLEKICGQIASENSQKDISMKSLSLIIMLLHDGGLLLNSESCPGLITLRSLLNCLIRANSGPDDNSELENRSIELVLHLLNFASSKDRILYAFISNYADATLRFTFRIFRHISAEAVIENINTYVQVTQKFFTADCESLAITKPVTFNHIERFEIESWNVIEDKQWSHNVRRFFGIKILQACVRSTSLKLRNYKFIGSLSETYKIPMKQPSNKAEKNNSQNTDGNLKDNIATEYYKFVAQLFCDYLEDEPVDEWLPDINWIEEVSYLIQVGGNDIFTPLVGMLSQIFFKEALKPSDIDHFKSVVRLCWKTTLGAKECASATEALTDLLLSSPFLEHVETRELTIECIPEMINKGEEIPELRVILLRGLKRLKGEYLSHFHDAVLTCLLHGRVPDCDQKVAQRACSYVLERYQEVYPNYLSNMDASTDVAVRAHAVTLLHKMITDDPTHAARLLPVIIGKLNETQTTQDLDDSPLHRRMRRILQVLLVLQPMLETKDIEILHTLLCKNIFSDSSQPSASVGLMQEWLLIRIYLDNESLLTKIWDLFDQGQEKQVDGICSVLSIVYHVARLLSTDLQLDFINAAFQHIMPCYMSYELNVRLNAQAVTSKLYDLASEKSYSTITEKYKELYTALKQGLKPGNPTNSSIRLEHDFNFTVFDPINDYSLETLFYELPRLSNVPSVEYIPPQLLEKFGFKEANSHPLKLLNSRNDVIETETEVPVFCSSKNERLELVDSDGSEDCSNERQGQSISDEAITTMEDDLVEVPETSAPN